MEGRGWEPGSHGVTIKGCHKKKRREEKRKEEKRKERRKRERERERGERERDRERETEREEGKRKERAEKEKGKRFLFFRKVPPKSKQGTSLRGHPTGGAVRMIFCEFTPGRQN